MCSAPSPLTHASLSLLRSTRFLTSCIYFLDPDDVVPPSVSVPPAPLVPRARADSHTKSEQERVILEPPVPTNPTHCQPKLPASDIITIRALSQRVNVLPVIARADTLTTERLAAVKLAIRRDLAEAGIGFGIFDVDPVSQYETPDLQPPPKFNGESSSSASHGYANGSTSTPASPVSPTLLRLPFALISPDIYSHSDGIVRAVPSRHEIAAQYDPSYHLNSPKRQSRSKLSLGKFVRTYRWGSLDIMDRNHCDFVYLRSAIFHHMEVIRSQSRHNSFTSKLLTRGFFFFNLCVTYRHSKSTQENISSRDLEPNYTLTP